MLGQEGLGESQRRKNGNNDNGKLRSATKQRLAKFKAWGSVNC